MSDKLKWYSEGLRFKCTECGKCCTGGPGVVWCDDGEIEAMAKDLGLSNEEFRHQYTRLVEGRISLKEKVNYDCILLKDEKCTVYKNRPMQCRTYPWWPSNLRSKAEWKKTKLECEGINPDAPLVSFEEIEAQRELQENHDHD